MNVKFHKITSFTWNFQKFTCIVTILVKFDIYFLGLPWEIIFGVITDNKLYLYPLISEAVYSAWLSASVVTPSSSCTILHIMFSLIMAHSLKFMLEESK